MNEKKAWPPCDICGKSVATKDGLLGISTTELDKVREVRQKWERKHPDGTAIAIAEYPEAALSVPWQWGHVKCLQEVSFAYMIEAERFLTIGDALFWTLHLQEKRWLRATDWEGAVRRFHKVPHP